VKELRAGGLHDAHKLDTGERIMELQNLLYKSYMGPWVCVYLLSLPVRIALIAGAVFQVWWDLTSMSACP
jgi:hypothetical protein